MENKSPFRQAKLLPVFNTSTVVLREEIINYLNKDAMINIIYGLICSYGKRWLFTVFLLCAGGMAVLSAQCLTASYGQWPGSTFTPSCTGSPQTITTIGWAGEYSSVNVVSGNPYTFSSSITTDYLTIANSTGSAALAWGTGSVEWTATFTGDIRFYTHTNSACGEADVNRTKQVACTSSSPPPPGNDCSNALDLATLVSPYSGSTSGFTDNFNISCAINTANDMIFYIDVPANNQLTIEQVTNSYDSKVAVFYGGACPGNTQIACWDDQDERVVTWINTTGSTQRVYWVQDGYSSGSGPFTISWSVQLPLDGNDCSNALDLATLMSPYSGSTSEFTNNFNISCAANTANDMIFYIDVPANNQLTIEQVTNSYDSKVAVFYGGACPGNTQIACWDDQDERVVTWTNTTGSTQRVYWVQDGFGSGSGPFTISWSVQPPCNSPGTPTASGITPTTAILNWTTAAGASSYEYSYGPVGHSCGTGAIATSGTSVNLTGLLPNTTYRFCVRTSTCGVGTPTNYVSTTFTTASIPNDECSGAIPINCGGTVNGNTSGAASDSSSPFCNTTPGNGIWYSLIGNGAQVTLSLCNSSYDTKINVYTGSCGALSCIAGNDDRCGLQSEAVFVANAGVTYYILVSGFGSSAGSFSMDVTCNCEPVLGAPWTVTSIGNAGGTAIDNVCDGTIDVSSNGFGSFNSDRLRFAWMSVCGNASITARIVNTSNGAYGGLMIRESSAPGARRVSLRTQAASPVVFRDVRNMTNGNINIQQVIRPQHSWLRLVRTGNVFTGSTSIDGITWQQSFIVSIPMQSCAQIGFMTQALNVQLGMGIFDDITLSGNNMDLQELPEAGGLTTGNETIGGGPESIELFPNPTADVLNVKVEDYMGLLAVLTVRNTLGQVVRTLRFDEISELLISLPVDQLPAGVYNLTLQAEGREPQTRAFVVNRVRP